MRDSLELLVVAPNHIDQAWRDGAHRLSEAFDRYNAECTIDQLRMRLVRGEATLLTIRKDGKHIVWVAVEFIQYPNMRALHVAALYARHALSAEAFELVMDYGHAGGASVIQCAASGAAKRLYEHKCGYMEAYSILRRPICQAAADHRT